MSIATIIAIISAFGLFGGAILMATDVVRGSSRIILTDDVAQLEVLPYPRRSDGTRKAEGVVSRKKQLLPLLLGALEG